MTSLPTRQPLTMEEATVPWKGQNWREPRAKGHRLLLQCENGITVPLVVVPSTHSVLEVDEQLLVPNSSCGLGVFSYSKPANSPAQRRASSTPAPERNAKTSWEHGLSLCSRQKNQLIGNGNGISRSYNTDTINPPFLSARVSEAVTDKTGKIDILNAIANNNPAVASKYGYRPTLSGVQPDIDKKEYCSYWIRTGECDYTQQGCRYKHEMPDIQTLNRIGFRDFPLWWKQRLFKRPTRPQNETLKKILAQESDSESSNHDTDSEASSARPVLSPANIRTPKRRCADSLAHVETPQTTPDLSDLIDFEPIKPQRIQRKPLQETCRTGRFIPYNETPSPHSSATIRPASSSPTPPPLRLGSPSTPAPTVPHPTPATSPELKAAKLNKDEIEELGTSKFPLPNIVQSELPTSVQGLIAVAKATAATGAKTIKPEDLQRQIENLQRYGYDVKQAASASRSSTPIPAAKPKKTGLRLSKYAKSSESDDAKPSSGPSVEREKRRRTRKARQVASANVRPMVPTRQSAGCRPCKPVRAAAVVDGAEKAKEEQAKESTTELIFIGDKK